MKRVPPGVALLLISPLLGELVSGHMNLAEFCNPLVFIVMALPYGCGALVCRDLTRRWDKGWLSLLLLGTAYGVFEEGIVSHAFFDPHWRELGSLGNIDYFAGINWTYSLSLVHFHVTISILSSVALAELTYPERRGERWLTNGQLVACGLVLALWPPALAVLAQAGSPLYIPPPGLHLLAALAVAGLIAAARLAPPQPLHSAESQASPPWRLFVLGVGNVTIVFMTVYMLPDIWPVPLSDRVVFLVLFNALSFWLFLRWSGNVRAWDDRQRLALIMGLLAFFVLFGFASDLQSFEAKSLVSLAAVAALWGSWRRVNARAQAIGDSVS